VDEGDVGKDRTRGREDQRSGKSGEYLQRSLAYNAHSWGSASLHPRLQSRAFGA
jgi:hypothetical protein